MVQNEKQRSTKHAYEAKVRVTIELLTMSSANVWKLSGLELKDILIQQN
jgi:hypothetical protein